MKYVCEIRANILQLEQAKVLVYAVTKVCPTGGELYYDVKHLSYILLVNWAINADNLLNKLMINIIQMHQMQMFDVYKCRLFTST